MLNTPSKHNATLTKSCHVCFKVALVLAKTVHVTPERCHLLHGRWRLNSGWSFRTCRIKIKTKHKKFMEEFYFPYVRKSTGTVHKPRRKKRRRALIYVPQMKHLSEQVKCDQSCFQKIFQFLLSPYTCSAIFGSFSVCFRGFNRPKKNVRVSQMADVWLTHRLA